MKCLTIYIESAMHLEKIVLNFLCGNLWGSLVFIVAWISSSQKSGAYFCHMHNVIVSAGFCDISWQGILSEKKHT